MPSTEGTLIDRHAGDSLFDKLRTHVVSVPLYKKNYCSTQGRCTVRRKVAVPFDTRSLRLSRQVTHSPASFRLVEPSKTSRRDEPVMT